MGLFGKPHAGGGMHLYYAPGHDKPNHWQKVWGRRKARYAAKRELWRAAATDAGDEGKKETP